MSWGQFLKLLVENKLFAMVVAIFTASTWGEKYDALLNLLSSLKPLIVDLLDKSVSTMSSDEILSLETRAAEAMAAADTGISAMALGDRIRKLKEIYDLLSPFLRLIGVPAPSLG
jgi:hypothetical protein